MKIEKVCEFCGIVFLMRLDRVGRRKFCSRKCRGEASRTGETRKCGNCGEEFYAVPGNIKKGYAKFCSAKCRDFANRNSVDRTCEQCGKVFSVSQSRLAAGRGHFCSSVCSVGSRKTKVRRICKTCSSEFYAKPSQIERRGALFCSAGCFQEWRRLYGAKGADHPLYRRMTRTCKQCGATFIVKRDVVKTGGGIFCSVGCSHVWRRLNYARGPDDPRFKKVEKTCETCGVLFLVGFSESERGKGRFCSHKCRGVWQSVAAIGANNGNWRGGTSFEPYPTTWRRSFKCTIRERDNYTCAICKLEGKDVHHINYVKKETILENCITLCKPCHGTTNGNRNYWQVTLSQIMDARWAAQRA